jgi:aspartate ammonia-lyase
MIRFVYMCGGCGLGVCVCSDVCVVMCVWVGVLYLNHMEPHKLAHLMRATVIVSTAHRQYGLFVGANF